MNFKTVLFVLIIALSSGWVGYQLRTPTTPVPTDQEFKAKYEELQGKFDKISQVDIEEYLKLKSLEERYKKADEILGKILMIMLYDLGLRSSEGQIAEIKNSVAIDSPASPNAAPPPVVAEKANQPEQAVAEAKNSDWKKETYKAAEIANPNDAIEFLKESRTANFFEELKVAGKLSAKQMETLRGSFTGFVNFIDPAQKPWRVEMWFDGRVDQNKYVGEHRIAMFNTEGKRFSRTTGKVGEDNYMAINGDANGMVINAYGDDGYFQLYYFPKLNEFYGNVYLKEGIGKFVPKGIVRLRKN